MSCFGGSGKALKVELDAQASQIRHLEKQNLDLAAALDQSQEQVQKLKTELKLQEDEDLRSSSAVEKLRAVEQEVKEARERSQDLDSRCAALQKRVSLAEAEAAEVKNQLHGSEKKMIEAMDSLRAERERIVKLEDAIQSSSERETQLETKIDQYRTDKVKLIEAIEKREKALHMAEQVMDMVEKMQDTSGAASYGMPRSVGEDALYDFEPARIGMPSSSLDDTQRESLMEQRQSMNAEWHGEPKEHGASPPPFPPASSAQFSRSEEPAFGDTNQIGVHQSLCDSIQTTKQLLMQSRSDLPPRAVSTLNPSKMAEDEDEVLTTRVSGDVSVDHAAQHGDDRAAEKDSKKDTGDYSLQNKNERHNQQNSLTKSFQVSSKSSSRAPHNQVNLSLPSLPSTQMQGTEQSPQVAAL